MKKTMTRFLAILCTLAMVFSMAPASMTVYAASEDANVEAAADGAEEQKEEEVVVEEKEEKVVEKKEEPAKEEKKEVKEEPVKEEKKEVKEEKVKTENKEVKNTQTEEKKDNTEKKTEKTSEKKAVPAKEGETPSEKTLTVTLDKSEFEYTGSDITPTVSKVTDAEGKEVASSDYTVSGSRKDVGTGTVTVTGKGMYDGYTGTASFTITGIDISKCTVTLSRTSFTYTGNENKPAVTVKNGSTTLVRDTDYTVSYSNNRNAGTGTAIVKGTGNYNGSSSANFKIAKAAQKIKVTINKKKINVRKYAQIKVTGNKGKLSYVSSSKKIAVVNSKGKVKGKYPGKVTITVKAAANNNYNAASKKITVKVKGYAMTKANTKITLSKKKYTYDGKAKKPKVKVKYKGKTLKKGKHYKVVYQDNINAGKAKVIIKGKGNYVGTVKKAYKIDQAKNPMKVTVPNEFVDINKTLQIKVKKAKGKVTYTSSDKKIATVDKDGLIRGKKMGDVKITVEAEGNDNYKPAKKVLKISVGTQDLASNKCQVTLSRDQYTYDGNYKKPTATVRYDGKKLKENTDYTITYKDNKNAGKASVIIKGKGHYRNSKTVKFTIDKSIQEDFNVIIPGNHITLGGVTQIKVTGYYGSLSYESKSTSYVVSLGGGRFQGLRKTTDGFAYIVVTASGDQNHLKKVRTIGLKVY